MYLNIVFPFILSIFLTSTFTWLKFRTFKRLWSVQVWPAFLVIFLGTWATSLWIKPLEFITDGYNYAWVAILAVGALLMIVLVMLLPEHREKNEKAKAKNDTLKELGIFFWILIIVLSIPIILGYTLT